MLSLYGEYLLERTEDNIIEREDGFVTYRILNKDQIYIIDIYVIPEMRKKGIATVLGDAVCAIGRERRCREVLGTVNLNTKHATRSLLVLIAYGMKLVSAHDNIIVMSKEL